ncbi:alpha/beta fold hydrolase [Streptomyces canus]|uniref:alpha/beta fold hydrolase n=1 Tax=Streptomyces canus TaxID=58343 RepID=UPI0030DE7789
MTETRPYVPPAHIVGSGAHKVIVLHSLFAGHESFSPWWPYLDGTRFSYAFMDARGFGDAIDVEGSYTCDEIASDVLLLADSLGWREFSLIGHSLGGMPVQQVVLKAPERVRKLVGLSPAPANGLGIPDAAYPLLAEAAHKVENRRIIIDSSTGGKLSPHWVASWAEQSMKAVGPDAFRGYLDSVNTTDFSAEITGAPLPALVVVGENDPATNADAMNQTWMRHYPSGQLAVIGNAGHHQMVETPIALATLVERFLGD